MSPNLQAELKQLRAQCDAAGAPCGILESLDKEAETHAAVPAKAGHVGGSHRRH